MTTMLAVTFLASAVLLAAVATAAPVDQSASKISANSADDLADSLQLRKRMAGDFSQLWSKRMAGDFSQLWSKRMAGDFSQLWNKRSGDFSRLWNKRALMRDVLFNDMDDSDDQY